MGCIAHDKHPVSDQNLIRLVDVLSLVYTLLALIYTFKFDGYFEQFLSYENGYLNHRVKIIKSLKNKTNKEMDRKDFLKNGALGLGTIIAIPTVFSGCGKDEENDPNACAESPTETAGPFPIKTPADWIRENIVGDRAGVPLMMTYTIQNVNDDCKPIEGVLVDVWQCDAKGNYSEYEGQLDGNFTNQHFLRGRQTTNAQGQATFISIYPGWYPGRTPHIHLEVKDSSGSSLLITQVSFPDDVSNTVYQSSDYKGIADTNNDNDGIVSAGNLADSLTGNTTDGYTLNKIIKVKG